MPSSPRVLSDAEQERRRKARIIRRIVLLYDDEVRAVALIEFAFRSLLQPEERKRALQYAWARFVEPYEPKEPGRG